jgi:hypothetical protein
VTLVAATDDEHDHAATEEDEEATGEGGEAAGEAAEVEPDDEMSDVVVWSALALGGLGAVLGGAALFTARRRE